MKVNELIAQLQKFDGELPVAVTIDPMVDGAAPATTLQTVELAYADNTEGDWLASHGDEINDDDLKSHVVIY